MSENKSKEELEIEKMEKELKEKKKLAKRKRIMDRVNKGKKKKKVSSYLGEGLATVQGYFDDIIDYTFQKLSEGGDKELPKDANVLKKSWYYSSSFVGDIGASYYRRYGEIKKGPNRAELMMKMAKAGKGNKEEMKQALKMNLSGGKKSLGDIQALMNGNSVIDAQLKAMKEKNR